MNEYKVGDRQRADRLGMKGRQYLTLLNCNKCNNQKWVRPGYTENFICIHCKHRETIKAKQMNKAEHRKDCKCHKCRIGKGYFKGKNNPSWKGGIKKMKSGYIYIYIEQGSKFSSMIAKGVGNGYVAQHRLVMAEHLDRPLLKEETVHHKNGIKWDNRIENLELWATKHHSGQRVEDLIKWAIEFLQNNNYSITKNKTTCS